jgi:hypothetical protein
VAKSRRFGLPERVGWLRRNDVDSEMWPEEQFGGVSDEQFWDDLSADKPLANTARTAQPDGESRPRLEQRPARPGQSRLGPLPGSAPGSAPADRAPDRAGDRTMAQPAIQAATQAFPAVSPAAGQPAAGSRTGPQPAYTSPQSAHTGPQPAYGASPSSYGGAQSAYTGPQSAYSGTGPQPAYTGSHSGPQPLRPATSRGGQPQSYPQSQHLPPAQSPPPAQSMPPAQSPPPTQGLPAMKTLPAAGASAASTGAHARGRHSSGEDPLTSDKFSLRSAPDGRSYQAARRSRDMSREQYDAALSQETQTFSMPDADGSGAYPAQPYPSGTAAPRRRSADDRSYAGDSYPGDPYGQNGSGSSGHQYPYSQQSGGQQPGGHPSSGHQSSGQQPGGQTPPYGESAGADAYDYGTRNSRASGEPRRAGPHRDGYGRPARPVYPDKRGPYDPRGGR